MLPLVTDDLLRLAREAFPVVLSRGTSEKDLHLIVGQQEVIRWLESLQHPDEEED
jgi:hypothetical protein